MDEEQQNAVQSDDGVVQVIALAGSGKTAVLIERVRELRSRGLAASRILCCTFNRAARNELSRRLGQDAVDAVEVRTFHGLGRMVLEDAGLLRERIGATTYGQWRWLGKQAKDALVDGVWIEPPEAQQLISDLKLERMLTPDEYEAEVERRFGPVPTAFDFRNHRDVPGSRERTAAALYRLHEDMLERDDKLDFDDLVVRSVRLLQSDEEVRARWQARFAAVLVDEYQDIEPAQELLVRILAAPEDILFVVGDEDQCIYSWRRATVERVVELDRLYPGLDRVALKRNYRCPSLVVDASRNLIQRNVRRFPKAIEPGVDDLGRITVVSASDEKTGAAHIARLVAGARQDDAVVLARTTRALTEVATGLAEAGVSFWAADPIRARLLNLTGEPGVLLAYLRLLAHPDHARPEDVDQVFRVPNRFLPPGKEADVAQGLRAGMSFAHALGRLRVEEWRRERLAEAASVLDGLLGVGNASDLIAALRTDGGLDRHFAEAEQLAPTQQVEVDSLESAERDAQGYAVADYAEILDYRSHIIEEHFDDAGVELSTIHGAKGRQWPLVIIASVDEGELPHARSLDNSEDRDDALEAERRLAYVAITRARNHLVFVHTADSPSRFIEEAAPKADTVDLAKVSASTDDAWEGESSIDPTKLRVDAKVRHRSYGEGRVAAVERRGPSTLLHVDFADGSRVISTGYGVLEYARTSTVPDELSHAEGAPRPDDATDPRTAPLVQPQTGRRDPTVVHVSLSESVSLDGTEDALVGAMVKVLSVVPTRSLSATLLTHVLSGSRGPKTQELISRHGLAPNAEFATTPFGDLRRLIIEVASADERFRIGSRDYPESA